MRIVKWFLSVTLFVSSTVLLAIPVDSCDYYDRLEAKLKCGETGYIQKFANPYCKAYLNRKNEFSPQGQLILRNIRLCLQEVLSLKDGNVNCGELESYGIGSHEYCYVFGGYCDLSSADRMKVFWVARGEMLNSHIWTLVAKVHNQCFKNREERSSRVPKISTHFL